MVEAALSVILVQPRPAENTLDPVDINGSSTCRTERRFWHWTSADGKRLRHFSHI